MIDTIYIVAMIVLLFCILAYSIWLTHKIIDAINYPDWAMIEEDDTENEDEKEAKFIHQQNLICLTPKELREILKREVPIRRMDSTYDAIMDVSKKGLSK
jgi:hypothetical protein